jgi:hypothetical protein
MMMMMIARQRGVLPKSSLCGGSDTHATEMHHFLGRIVQYLVQDATVFFSDWMRMLDDGAHYANGVVRG